MDNELFGPSLDAGYTITNTVSYMDSDGSATAIGSSLTAVQGDYVLNAGTGQMVGQMPSASPSDGIIFGAAGGLLAGLDAAVGSEAGTALSITTPYAVEAQSASPDALDALADAQGGAMLYRSGSLGDNMAAESQYWSLQNPLLAEDYANQMGLPTAGGGQPFVMGGTLNPGASAITNEAPGLGPNIGGGIQVVITPGGVNTTFFFMP